MTTRATEAAFSIVGDASSAKAALDDVAKRAQIAGDRAKQAGAAASVGMGGMATASTKAANSIRGAADALSDLGQRGTKALGDVTQSAAQFAGAFGPTGAVVGAIAISTVAIVSLVTRAKRELQELNDAARSSLRDLERSTDKVGLAKRINQLSSGDRLFGDPNSEEERSNATLRAKNNAIRAGGMNGVLAAQADVIAQQRALGSAIGLTGEAVEQYNKRNFELTAQLEALRGVEQQLRLERDAASAALKRLGKDTADVEKTAIRLKAADDARTKSLADQKRQAEALVALNRETENLVNAMVDVSAAQKQETAIQRTIEKYEALGVPIRAIRLRLAELKGELESPGVNSAETVRQIEQIRGASGKYLDEIDALVQGLDALRAADANKIAASSLKDMEALGDRTAAQNKALIEQRDRIDALNQSRAEGVADLEAEAQAIETSSAAYAALLKQRTIAAQLQQDEAAFGRKLTPSERAASEAKAIALLERAESAQQRITAAANKGISPLVAQFSDIATYAIQIASALGDSGKGLAQGGGILLGVLKGVGGLQEATLKRDANGKVVTGAKGAPEFISIAQALRGRNGSAAAGQASQAAALGSLVSIAGVVLGLADALDLFGTRAKQQREELRQRAEAFNQALGEFARSITERGIGEFAAQRNQLASELGGLAGKAAGSVGLTFSGDRLSAQSARAFEAQLRADAQKVLQDLKGKRGAEVAAGLEQARKLFVFADAIKAIGAQAEVAEAELRAQQAAAVRVASEDLSVRQLSAQGFSAEAAARRLQLDQQRELEQAITNFAGAEGYQAYVRALQEIQAAELAAAAATAARAKVMSELDAALAILGGSAVEQLRTTLAALSSLFPEFGTLFEGLDLDTREGLESGREQLRAWYRELAADGISDAEQPIVDAIRRFLGGIESALGALPNTFDQALEAFQVRTEVFGLTVTEQFKGLAALFGAQFPQLSEIIGSAMPTDGADRSALRTRIQGEIDGILADGQITEAERPYLAALQSFLGLVNNAIDDAAAELESLRVGRIADADRRLGAELAFGKVEGAEALSARAGSAAGLAPIFGSLLELFNDTSADGLNRSKEALYALFRSIEEGAVPLEQFGDLTKDEVIERILELNGNLDGLAAALTDAAKAAEEAAAAERRATSDLGIRLQRAQGADTRLAEFDLQASQQREDAIAANRSDEFLRFLDEVLGSERTKLLADIASEAANAAQDLATAAQTAHGATDRSSPSDPRSRTRNTTVVSDLGGLSEVTAQSLAGILREVAVNTGRDGAIVRAVLATLGPVPRIGALSFPSQSVATSSTGTGTVLLGPITIHIAALNPQGATPRAAAVQVTDEMMREISRRLGRMASTEARFLGSGKR